MKDISFHSTNTLFQANFDRSMNRILCRDNRNSIPRDSLAFRVSSESMMKTCCRVLHGSFKNDDKLVIGARPVMLQKYECMDCLLDLPILPTPKHIPKAEIDHAFDNFSQKRDYPVLIFKQMVITKTKFTSRINLLIAIKSICKNSDRRNSIRMSWGNSSWTEENLEIHSKTVFLLGACNSQTDQNSIEVEEALTNDIIQWDFLDTFQNLTVKQCLFLQFLKINASSITHVYQGDDDVFVNPVKLVDLIRKHENEQILIGAENPRQNRVSNVGSKYFVPLKLWPYKTQTYPEYVSGAGFLFDVTTGEKLFLASLKNWIFPIDDAFVGVLLKSIDRKPDFHEGFMSRGLMKSGVSFDSCDWLEQIVIFHRKVARDQLKIWKVLRNCRNIQNYSKIFVLKTF